MSGLHELGETGKEDNRIMTTTGTARNGGSGKEAGTKDRILDAAEELFAERGFEGTSVRAVTHGAGVNLNAMNYHFGSKEGLFAAVVRRVRAPINEEQLRSLGELEARREETGGEPSVEELVGAYVSPIAELLSQDEERGRVIARLIARILADPGGVAQRVTISAVEEVEERYLGAFSRALPHLSAEELWWRFRALVVVVGFHRVAEFPTGRPPQARPETEEDVRAWTVAFLTAALRAPATEKGQAQINR